MRISIGKQSLREKGFTLLEVLIAVAILAISLMILVSAQSSAAKMTVEADRILIATMLAKQRLAALELQIETEPGFSEQELIEEDGNFDDVFPGQFPEFQWRSQIKKVDLSGASSGGISSLFSSMGDDESSESDEESGMPGMEDLDGFFDFESITEQLARYIREISVTVIWGEGNEADEITITTHVIKPSGPTFYDPANP